MYRVRSTDLWFNAPGVVAAYQPVAAPDSIAARYNVGSDARMAGQYTAVPGVAPTWNPRTGWTFNGSSQYLETNYTETVVSTALCRFSGISAGTPLFGASYGAYSTRIVPAAGYTNNQFFHASSALVAGLNYSGVMGFSNRIAYTNGLQVGTIPNALATPNVSYNIGRVNGSSSYGGCTVQAFLVSPITLTPSHMAQYCRQMAYCHVNHDWSAWGRRRQYFYAPAVTLAAMRRRQPDTGRIGSRGVIE